MTLTERYGVLRSWLMYYAKPGNRSRLFRFYDSFIKEEDLVFDIGAHLGNRSRAFLDLGAKVVAVEPQPNCIRFLKNKFSNESRFILHDYLVSSEEGQLPFHISFANPTISTARGKDWHQQINSYSIMPAYWDQKIIKSVITLDWLIQKYGIPAFCKIDTEGFEWEVIQGLSVAIPALSLEYLAFDRERMIKCLERLSTLGEYRINFSPGESQHWYWKEWRSLEEVLTILINNQLPYRFGDLYFMLKQKSESEK